jgi:5-(carboxyamino)imidazole ribonucleotide synthase
VIAPPATLGILGGGQLGRYFVLAARVMGYRTIVLEPDPTSPAGAVADVHLIAPYDDADALDHLAANCAVVTTEFENPPAAAVERLSKAIAVHPSPSAIAIAQDRRVEKRFLTDRGFETAPFAVIETDDDVAAAAATFPFPAILKSARMGYDGKGQVSVGSGTELAAAWTQLGGVACVLEQRLRLDRELSVVLARTAHGDTAVYPTAQNEHVDGILDTTVVPAADAPDASAIALGVADALGYVGVLAVEMFVVDGRILVNELAPRPHNSGHWTLDVSITSQFEQQVRAVCGLPLGGTDLTAPAAAMVNLLGDAWFVDGERIEPQWSEGLTDPTAKLHLYGKTEPRPGRKMGHLTVTADSSSQAATTARALRHALKAR